MNGWRRSGTIEEQRNAWHGFSEPVQQTLQQALLDTDLPGAILLCDLLSPATPAPAPFDSLPRQRLFLINGRRPSADRHARARCWPRRAAFASGCASWAAASATC